MALPEQVVTQLNQGSNRTPGWSSGILLFSGSILFIIIFIYAGLRFGYETYINGQLKSLEGQVQKVGQQITPASEANLIKFYSQIANLESLIKGHVFSSQFLTWLEQNTEANVYYTSISFSSGGQVALVGSAKTAADVSEQLAVFEASPEVSSVSLSSVALSPTANIWVFNAVLNMQPAVFLWNPSESSPAVVVTSSLNTAVSSSTESAFPFGAAAASTTTSPATSSTTSTTTP